MPNAWRTLSSTLLFHESRILDPVDLTIAVNLGPATAPVDDPVNTLIGYEASSFRPWDETALKVPTGLPLSIFPHMGVDSSLLQARDKDMDKDNDKFKDKDKDS